MKRTIEIDPEDRQKLILHFGVTKSLVSMALSFQRHSLLCQQIRVYAMNHSGYAEIKTTET